MMNGEEIIITDNEFLRQFETIINEQLATIEYAQQERKIFLTKVLMPESLKEQGYMDSFIEAVLEQIKDRNTRVMPTSPDVVKFMRKNRRKYKNLLPVGINI